MKSNTKMLLDHQTIAALFAAAGIHEIHNIESLGAGEFNAVYAAEADQKAYALKIAPDSNLPVMTYEKDMMRSELFWYGQLREHTDILTPGIVYSDFSKSLVQSDFFIMERIAGRQMNEMEFAPQEHADAIAKLPQMAAQIHRIRHNGFGYPQCGFYSTWDQALYAMAQAAKKDAAAMGKPCENGDRVLGLIQKHRAVLSAAPCRMVNFDLWEGNILCERKNGEIQYVWIDPERGFWGDPIMDFVCFEFDKPLKEKRMSLEAYNRVAETPVEAGEGEAIRFAFAQAYLGLIMEVERYYRYAPGEEGWIRNDAVCKFLFDSAFSCLE